MADREHVVLLDATGNPVGSQDKESVHGPDTPLHLAFSCYLFNPAGELLLTRRALSKQTWPGVWTNSFCGHPAPAERIENAVIRRARDELSADITGLRLVLPHFQYRAVDCSGTVENEICPVFVAQLRGDVRPHPAEIADFAWVSVPNLYAALAAAPFLFSPWLQEQVPLLRASGDLERVDHGG